MMKYNRPNARATWGTMAKDWEAGVDYSRMIKERFEKAQAAQIRNQAENQKAASHGHRV